MTADEVARIFAHLRETCDPRGHDVLDALETVVQGHSLAEERLTDIHDVIRGREWAAGRGSLTIDTPVRLPDVPPVDTRDHSKAAEFRLVRGGRCV